ncbi:MAG: MMPL family transporter [Candidatus Aminicenantes bacterium]|nr:MMPL family transporter [Candidatus Aminicenantes bacterium]
MREKFLIKLSEWHSLHPWRMLGLVLILTVLFGFFASQLEMTMRVEDLLPSKDKKVSQLNNIIDEFSTSTLLVVVLQGEEKQIKQYADALAPQIEELTFQEGDGSQRKLFQRVDYKTPRDFLRNHVLMLAKAEDLENTKFLFTDPNLAEFIENLNDSMEREYVGQQESISTREKEDQAVQFLDGIQNLVIQLQKAAQAEELTEQEIHEAADQLLFGDSYMLSYDKKALLLMAIPNFTLMDRDLLMEGANGVQALLDDMQPDFPKVEAGLTGDVARERDEQVYAAQSFGNSTLIALVFILILLMVSFRMWIAPVLAVVNLIVGLIWGMGAAWLAVGQLNMVTSMMSVVLLGLGIDFSIHLISGFTERRAAGDSIDESMKKTFLKSGKGILTGGFTTACAFLTLLISQSRGMKQMGTVTGIGLLSVLLSTMIFLPMLLVFRERRVERKIEKGKKQRKKKDISFRFLGSTASWLSRKYVFTVIASVVVTGLLVWYGLNIKYDSNFMNLEPKGIESIKLMDTVLEKFDFSMEYAMAMADSVAESRELSDEFKDLGTVAFTDDISVYLPTSEEQKQRIPHILEVREKMGRAAVQADLNPQDLSKLEQEIARLEMNIIEIQDMAFLGGQDKVDQKCKQMVGDPEKPDSRSRIQELIPLLTQNSAGQGLSEFQRNFAPYFKENVLQMSSTEAIDLKDLPASIKDRYSNETRDKFLVTIFPALSPWKNPEALDRFTDDLERVTEEVTGLPPVFRAVMKIFARDGRNAVLLTLVIVFFLLYADFKKLRHALMAMVPLACGVFWMVGLMHLLGMKLNFMNLIGLPLIIGIGIDDGVHIMHRWRNEGNGRIFTVFSSTGKAIFLTTLTTMFAFGSLAFSIFRGWASFGLALAIGVGACFLTTVLILSGIMGIMEHKK